ncbi:hypothetical protein [Marinimicrobium agarilyticum]|uniref:hypothetical protein n=1 Tax=Marinimicrobium agarilyticum TaxID=306546 RepID=UPI00040E3B16|nr:hypothetical protein [Marinimicrobium agarilyticum]
MFTTSRYIAYAFCVSALLALSACGGSSTNIVEREPVENHDDHDDDEHSHGDAPSSKGRLVISSHDEPEVMVYDLDDGEELAHYPMESAVSAVYASANHRFALVLQRDGNQVNAIDAGFIREAHGDHFDYTIAAPSFSDFEMSGPRPTHFTLGSDEAVIFYDGNADTAEVAQVGVVSNANLANGAAGVRIELTTHQHGAARTLGEHLFLTVRDPQDTSTTLPDQVVFYHLHDGEYELEHTFEMECPALHGSAGWDHGVAFGCGDGVLVIHEESGEFVAEKIANPEGLSGRIGSLYATAGAHELVGVASGELFLIDPEAGTIEALSWTEDGREAVAYAFDAEGEHFLVLDGQGGLTRLEVEEEWTALAPIEVVASDLSGLSEDLRVAMAVSHASHLVYVTDPVALTVLEVDLESAAVTTALTLEAVPAKLAWTGFEGTHEEHDH